MNLRLKLAAFVACGVVGTGAVLFKPSSLDKHVQSSAFPQLSIRAIRNPSSDHASYASAVQRVTQRFEKSLSEVPGYAWRRGNWNDVHDAVAEYGLECEMSSTPFDEYGAIRAMYDMTDLDWIQARVVQSFTSMGGVGPDVPKNLRDAAGADLKLCNQILQQIEDARRMTTNGKVRSYMGSGK